MYPNQAKDDDGSLENSNIFSDLELDGPRRAISGDKPPPQLAKTAVGDSEMPHRRRNDQASAAFELWCFLQELGDVCKSVKEAREEYSRGEISFLAASPITDTAFGLMHRADDDFNANGSLQSSEWFPITRFMGLDWQPQSARRRGCATRGPKRLPR